MTETTSGPILPAYRDLPVTPGAPAGSSWGVFADARLGCLSLLTPERAAAATASVRRGAVFALDAEIDAIDPPLFGRSPSRHTVHGVPGEAAFHDDELDGWNTQASSQWDGFLHIRHPRHGYYGGLPFADHGVHVWAERGIVGRGVLADVGRWRDSVGRPLRMDGPDPIDPDDLVAALAAQGTTVEDGDILLVRTGWLGWYRSLDADRRTAMAPFHANPGLRPGRATTALLWDLHVAAVAADNPSLEVWPPGALLTDDQRQALRTAPDDDALRSEAFVHSDLLPLLGLPIGELWDLDALAEDCAADGRFTFLLTSAPLRLVGGVGTPPNALAIK
jgi:kynurenine formamidase